MILFGPGVIDVVNENMNIEIKSVVEKVSIIFPFEILLSREEESSSSRNLLLKV